MARALSRQIELGANLSCSRETKEKEKGKKGAIGLRELATEQGVRSTNPDKV